MSSANELIIRPGTLFLFVLIAALGIGMFTWASDYMTQTGEQSLEEQRQAIDCSGLDVDFRGNSTNETHTTFYIEFDQPVEAAIAEFSGEINYTHTETDFRTGELRGFSAPFHDIDGLNVYVQNCDRVFAR